MAIIRVSRFWSAASTASVAALASPRAEVFDDAFDGLGSFGSESGPVAVVPVVPALEPPAAQTQRWLNRRQSIAVAVICCAMVAAVLLTLQMRAAAGRTGTLTLHTTPSGLDVFIDGTSSGKTPLSLALPTGDHFVQIGNGDLRRDLSVSIVGGASLVHEFEFSVVPRGTASAPLAPAVGALRVQTDPPKQSVSVDGVDRGLSPVTVDGLSTGEHKVVVRGPGGVMQRTVTVSASQVLSLVIAPVESNVVAPGWLTVASPVALQMKQDGKLIGTTETDRLMLPAGDHAIEFVNEALGYRSVRTISVAANKTTAFRVELPSASLSLNALPWAEVWIDGERIGETPLANLSRVIGTHEVVFKHPQFGERRETVQVGLRQPARLGVDMRRHQP